jgi:hypothetical protein
MKALAAAILALALVAGPAVAEETRFYDREGHYQGGGETNATTGETRNFSPPAARLAGSDRAW